MFLLLIVAVVFFVLGFAEGKRSPTVLAAAQADLHAVQAEATAVETKIRARSAGISLHPFGATETLTQLPGTGE